MKSKLKSTLILLIIIVLCLSVGVYAGYTLSATEVSYTKPGETTPISVKDALDELHANMPISVTATNIGDEVTVGGEQFYVLSFNDYDRTVNLIAKYNLNSDGTAQSSTEVDCVFSSTNYWSSESNFPYNLNEYEGFKSTDALGKAKSYGRSKGAVSSRLLSYEEAIALETKSSSNSKIESMYVNRQVYWLGSASNAGRVWRVSGSGYLGINSCVYNSNECRGPPSYNSLKI